MLPQLVLHLTCQLTGFSVIVRPVGEMGRTHAN
jgi:hypothetical protein